LGSVIFMPIKDLKKKFFIVAHRGASYYEPENTIRAFKRALEMSADVIEFDVRVSGDGVPVVIHDPSVDRTTNGHGLVKDLTLEELKKLDAGLGEKIPTLQETLEFLKGKVNIFIEIKTDEAVPLIAECVERFNLWDDVMFISFNKDHLLKIREYRDLAYTGFIYINPKSGGIVTAINIGSFAVLPYYRLATKKAIAFAHRVKMIVVPWIIDDVEIARRLKDDGADGIATNRPDILIRLK